MSRFCGLIYPSKEIEGNVQPLDWHLLPLIDLLEAKMIEILEIIITCIDSFNLQLLQLDLLQSA